ncbi:hypothetical protein GCM10020216_086180 [Nonomuraea helvata]
MRPVVACISEATVGIAAERGLPMLLGMHIGDAEKAALVAEYGARGGTARDHLAAGVAYVADSTAEAVREIKESLPRWLGPGLAGYVPVDGRPRPSRHIPEYVDLLTRIHPVGSAEHCAESILRTAEVTGIDRFILLVEGLGEHRRTLENVRRLGAEVLPMLRR